ncbi:MAG: type III toxin-antitoxin system ToxN/AbiQ family toxin [bacterium]|nr:type III toxin-antitoxin system ToxN/AbiQ family toxin [bacterium]
MSLKFYNAERRYGSYLRQFDARVPWIENDKEGRPFIGILFEVNSFRYFAPLSSPKPKHLLIANAPDFVKINEGTWGAINLNNMIPIDLSSLLSIDMKIKASDDKPLRNYKELLNNQLDWCNAHEIQIVRRAVRLHTIITKGLASQSLKARCCDFSLLEEKSLEFR